MSTPETTGASQDQPAGGGRQSRRGQPAGSRRPDAAGVPSEHPAVEGFSAADTSDVAGMSYEQARAELVETVSRLETGGAGLEESLALWERGEALADRCEAWLDGARHRLQEVRDRTAGPGQDDADPGTRR